MQRGLRAVCDDVRAGLRDRVRRCRNRFPPSGKIIFGNPTTFNVLGGTNQEDIISGGFRSDWIFGKRENDILIGLFAPPSPAQSGALGFFVERQFDRIVGGQGDGWAFGGLGDDELPGQAGEDLLAGGFGDDRITGGANIGLIFGDTLVLGDEALALLQPILQLVGGDLLGGGLLGPSGETASAEAGLPPSLPPLEELLVQIGPPVQAGPVEIFGEDEVNVVIGELGALLGQLPA